MAEKNKFSSSVPKQKVVSMKLFATWEVEKSSPNCIPRICSLTLSRLRIEKSLEADLVSVIIAVKMASSKRVLRSNEIEIPGGGPTDVELDLSFMLQYPHFLKRDGNKLQVILQRRNRYKNRPIIGYKTLAIGQISMAQVLQQSMDHELFLYHSIKDHKHPVATVTMLTLSSQPVDHEETQNGRRKLASDVDRSPDVDADSEEEEGDEEQEIWSNDDLSDSEPTMMTDGHARPRKVSRSKVRPFMNRQRNFKQKFVSLLKRFKLSEEVLDSEADHDLGDPDTNPRDIDDLFEEFEDLSDSEPDLDTMSVMSTPKPRLRPFFTGRGSSNEIDRNSLSQDYLGRTSDDNSSNSLAERDSDQDLPDITVPSGSEVTISNTGDHTKSEPRKALLDQLGSVLDDSEDKLPDSLFLVNTAEWQGQLLVQKLQDKQLRLISTCSDADVRAAVNFLVSAIQKFCNYNSRSPNAIKVGVVGGDGYINSVLRPYVEQFSAKSPDWQNYVRFLVIPFGASCISKYLGNVDSVYSNMFLDTQWKDTFEKSDGAKLESQEIVNRMCKYLSSSGGVVQIPIAEAMVMCKSKSSEEESSQIFVPFLSEVKIGCAQTEAFNASIDFEECSPVLPALSSSPPHGSGTVGERQRELHTPPNSPSVGGSPMFQPGSSSQTPTPVTAMMPRDYVELQVDYWTMTSKPENTDKSDKSSKKDGNKSSLKSAFKSVHVSRLPACGSVFYDSQAMPFTMVIVTREKKQKIRIGKKPKEAESKSQVIDSISRLICTSKSQNYTLKVAIDGVEWSGVKFFQLSSQWQTHMRHLPVVVFGHPDQGSSVT